MTPPIVGRSSQIEGNGTILEAVMSVANAANSLPAGMKPWPKGVSGNPSGRPKLARPPSVALAELNDTSGETPADQMANYKTARGVKWCAADEKACATFKRDLAEAAYGVAAFDSTTDRLEGKVPQAMNVKSEATLTINVLDRDVQLAMLRAARRPELLEAEVVEEDK
jgi:hypothetical protein